MNLNLSAAQVEFVCRLIGQQTWADYRDEARRELGKLAFDVFDAHLRTGREEKT